MKYDETKYNAHKSNSWHTLPLSFNMYKDALAKARKGENSFLGQPGFWKFMFQYIEDLNERIERLEDKIS